MEDGLISSTDMGMKVNEAMLSPRSAFLFMRCLEFILSKDYDDDSISYSILILVGLTTEISNYDKMVRNCSIPVFFSDLKQSFQTSLSEYIDINRLDIAVRHASVLYYWISSLPTYDILKLCGIDRIRRLQYWRKV
jgi:replicative superfamily II helicase